LETVVAFPNVPRGDRRQLLLQVADQLAAELGFDADLPALASVGSPLACGNGISDVLPPEDESLVVAMRLGLARVAAAAGATAADALPERAVRSALDGAEMVIRGELVSGNGARLKSLMPSFVFLVTLPMIGQDRALELSERAAVLIDEASEE
jgi:hypothetical protein